MRCEDAIETMRAADSQPGADLRAALDHAAACDDCQAALRALDALRTLRDEPAPIFDEAAVERAIDRALTASPRASLPARILERFGQRRGAGRGGRGVGRGRLAVASRLATAPIAVPEVRLALNQRSDVTVTLESPEPLAECRSAGRSFAAPFRSMATRANASYVGRRTSTAASTS